MVKVVKHNVYFIGIGGIGMSALARYFMANGHDVYGYDKTETTLTKALCAEGAIITYTDNGSVLPKSILTKEETTVIITPAIPVGNKITEFFKVKGFKLYKRSDILGLISKDRVSLCVAGTHGKTTISTMAAFFLHTANVACTGFLGGISVNTNSNLILDEDGELTVFEADEFDRTFLKLYPNTIILSSTDADHLDIYGSEDGVKEGFQMFVDRIASDGTVFVNEQVELRPSNVNVKCFTYGLSSSSDCYAEDLKLVSGKYQFNLVTPFGRVEGLKMMVPGILNVENAVGALSASLMHDANPEGLKKAVELYKGIKRRFEVHIETPEKIYIDDYAHHPSEISKTLHAVRSLYPSDKVAVAFQPHLYSRTNDFADAFAEELDAADEVYLMDIYPARELPMEGVTSEMLLAKMKKQRATVVKRENVVSALINSKCRVVLTMGAGDIDRQVSEVVAGLTKK